MASAELLGLACRPVVESVDRSNAKNKPRHCRVEPDLLNMY